jgi:c-di-AMP phosphodiesterase-like protein
MKTDDSNKLKMHRIISLIIIIIGILLMMMKIFEDSEPGAIPLLLIIVGAGWYLKTRARIRSQQIKP